MGSFSAGGQRYSLTTADAMKALHSHQHTADVVYIGNRMHVVQPLKYSMTTTHDDSGKFKLYWYP